MTTTSSPGSEATYRFGRRSSRGLILGFSAPRVAALGVAVGLAVAGLFTARGLGLAVTAVVWAPLAATAFVRVGGRPAVEWAATATHYGLRRAAGQTEYRSRLPQRPRPAGTLALPGDAAALRFHHDPASGAVMVHDPHRRTLTAAVGVAHPAFVLLDVDDRVARVARWGRVYAMLAQTGAIAAVQVLEQTVPDPSTGQDDWYATHGTGDGSWPDRQYRALLDQVRLAAGTHRSTLAVSLDLRAAGRAAKAAGGGITGAAAVLRADMATVADGLRQAGLTVGAWLDEAALAGMIRTAYDPAVTLDAGDPAAHLAHAGPIAINEGWDRLRHDSGYSAVLWIADWPRIDVAADFLHAVVFAPDIRRSLSIIARPLPTGDALRQLRRDKTDAVADAAQKAKIGQLADLADSQEYEDLLARERSVVAGHTDVEFAGLVTVTAPGLDALEAAVAAITRAAAQAACELRPLYGRQAQGFTAAALPLARRIF
ncbi:MAG TPA: SCO6880 family protein [Acidimicrobiales bacterium]|nr:SCO6880 family protein [Acidimicrobiales bacterium]